MNRAQEFRKRFATIPQGAHDKLSAMNTSQALKRIIAVPALAGALAAAGLSLAAGTAQAAPPGCSSQYFCWCPGQPEPKTNGPLPWDMNSCHNYHYRLMGPGVLLTPPPGFCRPALLSDNLYDRC